MLWSSASLRRYFLCSFGYHRFIFIIVKIIVVYHHVWYDVLYYEMPNKYAQFVYKCVSMLSSRSWEQPEAALHRRAVGWASGAAGEISTDYPYFISRKTPFMIVIHLLSCGMCSFCTSCISCCFLQEIVDCFIVRCKITPLKALMSSVMSALCQRCVIKSPFLNFFWFSDNFMVLLLFLLPADRKVFTLIIARGMHGQLPSWYNVRPNCQWTFFRFFSPFFVFTTLVHLTLLVPFYPHLPGFYPPCSRFLPSC